MPRDPNIPDAFDVYTLVLLRRPADAPQLPDEELDRLQAGHLAYRAQLRTDGVVVAQGLLLEQSDESLRGLSIFACDLERSPAPIRPRPLGPGGTARVRRVRVVGRRRDVGLPGRARRGGRPPLDARRLK
jgi:hypothetical protein